MQFNLNSPMTSDGSSNRVNVAQGMGILFSTFVIMLFIVSLLISFVVPENETTTRSLRLSTIIQDLFVFITPAILAAALATRLPAKLLSIDRLPRLSVLALGCIVLIASIPAMDLIIELNESINLPDIFGELEDSAEGQVDLLIGSGSFIDIVMSILIIGVLTGLAEELFFRGALQGLFFSTRINRHAIIWIVAIIFSALHFQFYGFIPRMLLGAYFGYLVWWSGSLWTSVAIHALNNSIVAVSQSLSAQDTVVASESSWSITTIILSFVVTAVGLYILYRLSHPKPKR
jgi:hypothetical protein